jgi:group I intron endonuclease
MERKMLVYLITNKVNGRQYVGQHAGANLEEYWRDRHVYFAQHGYQESRPLYRAILKYGPDNFIVRNMVEVNSKEEMDFYERLLIRVLNTKTPHGYNLTDGGEGTSGFIPGQETRDKMSKSHVGLKMPESHSRKLSERNMGNKYSLGKKMTVDNFNKLMAVHVGAKRTDEARQRMSEAHKGKPWTEKQKFARHNVYHIKRGIINPNCKLCKESQC